jgi:hypothetical protein
MASSLRHACFTLIILSGVVSGEQAKVTPIQKVLQLMNDMVAKGTKEKNEEAVKFSAFSQWCTDTKRTKSNEIAAGEQKMEELNALIDKKAVEIKKLTERILELEEDVGRWKADQKSATAVRNMEEADYTATLTDYSESIDAISGAIEVLKKQAYNRNQAELVQALMQVRSKRLVPKAAKDTLTSFIQVTQPDVEEMPDDQLFYKAPEAYGYEFQSGGVVDMLVKLGDEFGTKKADLIKEEMKAKKCVSNDHASADRQHRECRSRDQEKDGTAS